MTKRFASLAEMMDSHAALVEELPDEHLADSDVERVESFLRMGAATGRILDAPGDRRQAQGLLDYWSASLLTSTRQSASSPMSYASAPARPSEAVLAPFDASSVDAVVVEAERRFQAFSAPVRKLALQVLLRLVRLSPSDKFTIVEATREQLQARGDVENVDVILRELETAGALRSDGDAVSLSYEALTQSWKTLKDALDQRAQFREAVRYWRQNGEHSNALISGDLLDQARTYSDLDDVERKFIDQSGAVELRRATQKRNALIFVSIAMVVLSIVAVQGWVRAARDAESARHSAEFAGFQEMLAKDAAKLAKLAQTEAESERANAQAARDALQVRMALSEIVNLSHTLATISFADSRAEIGISLHRLRQQQQRLSDTPAKLREQLRIDNVVKQLGALFHVLNLDTLDVDDQKQLSALFDGLNIDKLDVVDLRRLALNLAREIKDRAAGLDDLKEELSLQQKATYSTVKVVAGEIFNSFEHAPYEAAGPLIKEFWIMYWGEMGLFEGDAVQGAMIAFGSQLEAIDDAMSSSELDKVFGEGRLKPFANWSNWQRTQIIQSDFGARGDLDAKMFEKRVSPEQVEQLRTLLSELIQALNEELGTPIGSGSKPLSVKY